MRGINILPIEEVESWTLSTICDLKARCTVRLSRFLRFFTSTKIRQRIRLMHPTWVFGHFDKGTTTLQGACKGYFYAQFEKNIIQAPMRR